MKQKLKMVLGLLIIIATVGAFVYYVRSHPQLITKIQDTHPLLLAALLGLYLLWFLALVIILRLSLRLFGKRMSRQENILLNAYSSLINFFGPGQSGPLFRGLYLKRRHGLRLKDYLFATVLYYGFYAVVSAFFVMVGSRPWWQTVLGVTAVGTVSFFVIRWQAARSAITGKTLLSRTTLAWLFVATASQVCLQAVIFYLELQTVMPDVSLAQVLSYTGTANFAVFASITPGAIGIREALLVFSQTLHGIGSSTIVAANVIDRGVYFVLLGVLFVMTLSLHAKDKLGLGMNGKPS